MNRSGRDGGRWCRWCRIVSAGIVRCRAGACRRTAGGCAPVRGDRSCSITNWLAEGTVGVIADVWAAERSRRFVDGVHSGRKRCWRSLVVTRRARCCDRGASDTSPRRRHRHPSLCRCCSLRPRDRPGVDGGCRRCGAARPAGRASRRTVHDRAVRNDTASPRTIADDVSATRRCHRRAAAGHALDGCGVEKGTAVGRQGRRDHRRHDPSRPPGDSDGPSRRSDGARTHAHRSPVADASLLRRSRRQSRGAQGRTRWSNHGALADGAECLDRDARRVPPRALEPGSCAGCRRQRAHRRRTP